MKNFMFASRNGALGFAALVVIGALVLVGGEDDPGTVIETSGDIAESRAEFQRQMDEANDVEALSDDEFYDDEGDEWAEDDDSFFDDEELIDDAEGFDPTPAEDHVDEEVVVRDF